MQVPAFLLRRLYVKGSLRNANGGFEFDLKNSLGSGYAEQVLPLTVDGTAVPETNSRFVVDGKSTPFVEISASNPMTLGLNKVVTIAVEGQALADGKHKIGIGFMVTGMGKMQFDVTDAVDASSPDGSDGD